MSKLLLIIIYIAFIGLGLPDSLFGTAWPAIYTNFSLPISFGSFVSVTVACGTIISSIVSSYLIRKFGTGKVTAFSTLLTAVSLLGFSFSPNIWCMVLLSIPLGIGAGAIDVALNNYVALHYSASQMSFLHCFYGIGVSVSPYVLSLVISGESGWRNGYRIAFIIQIFITAVTFMGFPLWERDNPSKEDSEKEIRNLPMHQILCIPGVKYMCALSFITFAIECVCSAWGSTFLVEYRSFSTERAAQIVFLYFIGMATGRFLSGVLATKFHSLTIIKCSLCILGVAIALLFMPDSIVASAIGLFLVGFGNGPLFPNYNYLVPESFGSDISQTVISMQMASGYSGMLIAPMICGLLGQTVGMFVFTVYLLIFYMVLLLLNVLVIRVLRNVHIGSTQQDTRCGDSASESGE